MVGVSASPRERRRPGCSEPRLLAVARHSMFFHSDPSGVPMGIGDRFLPQLRHLAFVSGTVKRLGAPAAFRACYGSCALTLFCSPLFLDSL